MSSLATILGTYAPGHVLTHEGKDYTFGRIDKAKRVALEVAYFKRAREGVYAQKDDLTERQFDRQLTQVTDDYRRGQYGFPFGESYTYYMGEGLSELVALVTGRTVGEADSLCDARKIEVMHVVLCVVTESFGDLKKKLLQMADSPQMQGMIALFSEAPTSNGSHSSRNTTPPDSSPTRESASSSTPG